MRKIYITTLASFILVSVFLTRMLPFWLEKSSTHPDQTVPLASLLPKLEDMPTEAPAEFAAPVAQNVLPDILPRPDICPVPTFVTPQPLVTPATARSRKQLIAPVPVTAAIQPPMSFVYFSRGTMGLAPVVLVPKAIPVFYAGRITPAALVPTAPQSFVVPVFVPKIVPNHVGTPIWVYP